VECHSKILQTSREVRSQPRADGSSTARQITGSRVRKSATTGDDRSVKIKTLEAAKLTEIKWLVLGYIDADFLYRCRYLRIYSIYSFESSNEIYQIYIPLHLYDLNNSANVLHEFGRFFSYVFERRRQHFTIFVSICAETSPNFCVGSNFVGIARVVQKMLPHTENLKNIHGLC
jgi:hypothetical protein